MSGVTLNKVIKKYGETQVIHGVDLQIEDGEFCVFVGPSGCGKSTLLRMIAGLEEISRGSLVIDTREVTAEPPAKPSGANGVPVTAKFRMGLWDHLRTNYYLKFFRQYHRYYFQ